MKGDFSRITHNPKKNFTRVYKQQGRAELDADFNEHSDIAEQLDRTRAVDVIGKTGVPKGDGFKIGVTANLQNLTIQPGRIYVEGIVCSLAAPATYRNQPDYVALPPIQPAVNRRDLVYLDVWERHITAVEDPALLDPALLGADTTTRVRTIAQVKIQTQIPLATTCSSAIPNWPPAPGNGTLSTSTAAAGPSPNPCVLPPSGGYRGLENRLYRVEIHQGGSLATARFKWSRDNASILLPIEFRPGEPARVSVEQLGRDRVLALRNGDWVEVSGDQTDLRGESGTLAQIIAISEGDLTLTLSKDISAHWPETHPKIRRWDQTTDAMSLNGGASIALEDGIQVSFAGTAFRTGDYWTFTARAGEAGLEILANSPPQGVRHHYARLAIITWAPDPNNPAQILPIISDCRPQFPPLTAITASDVSFQGGVCQFGPGIDTVQEAIDELCKKKEECCTVVVRPDPGWESVFNTLPASGAHLCFRAGEYKVSSRVMISNKQSIIITGAGPSTRLIAEKDECVLQFSNCPSVHIHDIAAEGMETKTGSGPAIGIRGVFAVDNASDVHFENLQVKGTNGAHRTSACLSVHGAVTARVKGCRLDVGIQQVGLLLVNVQQSRVTGNRITGSTRTISAVPSLVEDPQFRGTLRLRLVTNLSVGSGDTANLPVNVTGISVGGQPVRFLGPSTHVLAWKNLLASNPLRPNSSVERVKSHILGLASQILLTNPFPSFSGVRTAILSNSTVSAQGITIGGTTGHDIDISSNVLRQVMQGIHVALSARNPNVSLIQRAVIHDNRVDVTLGLGASRGRHGIFVGNVTSLSARGNRLTLARPAGTADMVIDGIRVFGRIGRFVMVRENHLSGFNNGVVLVLRGPVPAKPMWRINQNLAENSSLVVIAPAAADRTDNFA